MYILPQTEFLGEKPVLDVDDNGVMFFATLGLDKFDRKDVIEVFARDASRGLQPPNFDDLDEVVTVQGALDLLGKSSESDF